MNVGIIGVGLMGQIHLNKLGKLQDEGRINVVAVADINKEKITPQRLENYGVSNAETFTDYKKLLKDYGDELDAINIATPTSTHFSIARDVLNRDINVLIEKPGCETKEQAIELKKIADSREKTVHVGYQVRFKPPIIYAKKVLEDEGLKVHSIRGSFGKYQTRTSTGAHRDLSSHGLDFINMFMKFSDFDKPVIISGFFTRYAPPNRREPRESLHDSTLTDFELLNPIGTAVYVIMYGDPEKPDKSAIATLDSSFNSSRRFGELHLRCIDPVDKDRVELYLNLAEVNYSLPASGNIGEKSDFVDGLFSQGIQYLRAPSHGKIGYSDARLIIFPGMESEDSVAVKARQEIIGGINATVKKYRIEPDIQIIYGKYDSIYEENKAWVETLENKNARSPLASIDDAICVHNIISYGIESDKYHRPVLFEG